MKKKKRIKKLVKNSKFFKVIYLVSLGVSIILEIVTTIYLCKEILNILNFGLITAVLVMLCMITLGQYITFEEMEEMENNINSNILKMKANIKKDK